MSRSPRKDLNIDQAPITDAMMLSKIEDRRKKSSKWADKAPSPQDKDGRRLFLKHPSSPDESQVSKSKKSQPPTTSNDTAKSGPRGRFNFAVRQDSRDKKEHKRPVALEMMHRDDLDGFEASDSQEEKDLVEGHAESIEDNEADESFNIYSANSKRRSRHQKSRDKYAGGSRDETVLNEKSMIDYEYAGLPMLSKGNEEDLPNSDLLDTGAVPSDYRLNSNMLSMSQGVLSRGSR